MITLFDTGLIQSALEKNVPIITSNVSKAVLSFFARLYNSGDYWPPGPSCSKGWSSIPWIAQMVSLILIRWIEIYPVDSAIQLLNNRDQENPGSKYRCINPGKTWQRTSLSGATWRKPNQSLSSCGRAAAENKYTARKSRMANTWAP